MWTWHSSQSPEFHRLLHPWWGCTSVATLLVEDSLDYYPSLLTRRFSALSTALLIYTFCKSGVWKARLNWKERQNGGEESGYFPKLGRTTNQCSWAELSIPMASLVKITVQNLVRSRSVVAPIVARSFAYRTVKIDPVWVFVHPFILLACRQ